MLQVARLAPKQLADSAPLVEKFLRGKLNPDGGFQDRSGASDLYYTVFGLESLQALRVDLPINQVLAFLKSFGDGADLDFIHLSCLARCWASMPTELRSQAPHQAILQRLEAEFRSDDGGYAIERHAKTGTVYGCFMAMGTHQDCGSKLPDGTGVLNCIADLKADDGGYANQQDVPFGLVPATAAAVTLLRQLEQPMSGELAKWLLERTHPEGGFFATPMAPLPDLLSTATALHALECLHANLDPIREPCLDFIDTLWTSEGSFHGSWADDILDCEYTYYGLLALGHLSV